MAFELPSLAYEKNALEPHIDAQTMEIHHGKHHNAYVTNLSDALKDQPAWSAKSVDQICREIGSVPDAIRVKVRNNGGGHYNHSLFWTVMGPKKGGAPGGELASAIQEMFGGFDGFKKKFAEAAMGRFGSGWAWLGVKDGGGLCLCSTPNQDNPLMKGLVDCPCQPILGLDVWEHAYYLKYQNRRADYIAAWWNVVDWGKVAENFAKATKK
ncbi:MAG: superoxide dismutase [Planctomycetes bacterium]|nr:superoxide dismutase [Planctomycetota bacterium]